MPVLKTIADELAKHQKEISISEFFTRNRHLLGFDNPIRALLMTVKEAVDNSLDACAEMKVLPEIKVKIEQLSETRFKVIVEDNGPGIVKEQIPNIFARLLYGSKFHTLKQNRGQQGIGISASVLYSQLTTGKPTKISSKVDPKRDAHYYELNIDTKKNEPKIVKDKVINWNKDHGTKVELELEGKYQKGRQSVLQYLKQTALVNPEASITYINPEKKIFRLLRVTDKLARESKAIKPHPYGIELGTLIKMLHDTEAKTLQSFLQKDFSRIGANTAKEICKKAGLKEKIKPNKIEHKESEKLFTAMQETKIIAPPTDCLSPIGSELLEKSLKKTYEADFVVTLTRPPSVYRGMPFQIEIGIAYGGNLEKEKIARVLRFANKVPLLYQQGACSITESVSETNWKPYGLQQSGKNMPVGPAIIVIHIFSVWVPFTSESKEAIAHYPEIIKEMKLALQDCGRKLGIFIRKTVRAREQREKINLFEKYIPELATSLADLSGDKKENIVKNLEKILKKGVPDIENAKKEISEGINEEEQSK